MHLYNEMRHNISAELNDDDSNITDNDFTLKPHQGADNPVLTNQDIDDCLARFVADPFVIYHNGIYNMFFEIKSVGGRVFIGHAFSKNGINYEYNRIILNPETAEHTYPHVFRWNDTWIMVPSPGSNVDGEFRVYEAVDFPTEWELIAIPITEGVRLDPTPIFYNDTWYLIYQNMDYNVVVMYSNSLTDGWHEHPHSPIFENDTEAIERCAIGGGEMVPSGRPLYSDAGIDIFYRSHIKREVYRYRITDLTEDEFSQFRVSEDTVFANMKNEDWNSRFMHTISPVRPWDGADNIIAVDGLAPNKYRWSIGVYSIVE